MKRYRVLAYSFDTRAVILDTEIQESWEEQNKTLWLKNKSQIKDELICEFGPLQHERKFEDFIALGASPISLLAFHNVFLKQCRDAFVFGSYYPALVSACTLGERILNHLILRLRDHFKSTSEYKKIYRKESFDNWLLAIDTLESWQVLLPEPAQEFRELETFRHKAIHFKPETDHNARELALDAIKLLQSIVEHQFSAFGLQPWYIQEAKGVAYVAKAYEQSPFVIEVVLPSCVLVGPKHRLEHDSKGWIVLDDHPYEEKEISDEEFVSLLA